MKKTFPLKAPGKDDARVRDKIRHEINKYAGRMRRQEPPTGYDFWTFTGKVGASAATAEPKPLKELGTALDAIAATGANEVYIEIIATPEQRKFAR